LNSLHSWGKPKLHRTVVTPPTSWCRRVLQRSRFLPLDSRARLLPTVAATVSIPSGTRDTHSSTKPGEPETRTHTPSSSNTPCTQKLSTASHGPTSTPHLSNNCLLDSGRPSQNTYTFALNCGTANSQSAHPSITRASERGRRLVVNTSPTSRLVSPPHSSLSSQSTTAPICPSSAGVGGGATIFSTQSSLPLWPLPWPHPPRSPRLPLTSSPQ
jgi:hypothetical protein